MCVSVRASGWLPLRASKISKLVMDVATLLLLKLSQ